jgi:hypothetical protein
MSDVHHRAEQTETKKLKRPRKRRRPSPPPDALGYTLPDASATSGLGRTSLYEAMNDGRLQYTQVGDWRIINGPSLRRTLHQVTGAMALKFNRATPADLECWSRTLLAVAEEMRAVAKAAAPLSCGCRCMFVRPDGFR